MFNEFKFNSLKALMNTFPDEQSCIVFLEKILWNGNPVSPFDKTAKVYRCSNNRYKCSKTKKTFTVKSVTIFKNSNISLRDWFIGIWLYTSHKCGLSSMQLHRDTELTQKTTWFMLKRLKECSAFENGQGLENEVEVDETYVGGKNKNRHANKKVKHSQGRSYLDKIPVFGMLERGGKVNANVVSNVTNNELQSRILRTVNIFSDLYSDEWGSYNGLDMFYNHSIVNHGNKQYVNGNAHTNTIENFWSNFKRAIIGVYRVVSRQHLQRYVDEFVFRYNTRKMTPRGRFIHLITNIKGCNLTYNQLILRSRL
ncbi:IS1595 family transposase [Riemerella anatipestifer]|uniref:IS1595 family transposase n=1 Tax=Riemerella anatipestifer TaxID=34085 RepID=UPI00390579BA